MRGLESRSARLVSGFWLAKEAVLVVKLLILLKAREQQELMKLEPLELDLEFCGRDIVECGIPEVPNDFQ